MVLLHFRRGLQVPFAGPGDAQDATQGGNNSGGLVLLLLLQWLNLGRYLGRIWDMMRGGIKTPLRERSAHRV